MKLFCFVQKDVKNAPNSCDMCQTMKYWRSESSKYNSTLIITSSIILASSSPKAHPTQGTLSSCVSPLAHTPRPKMSWSPTNMMIMIAMGFMIKATQEFPFLFCWWARGIGVPFAQHNTTMTKRAPFSCQLTHLI